MISSGGFDSVTEKHKLAEELVRHIRAHDRVEVLHIGDHDPSGAHIFLALAEDVKGFADYLGQFITFTRLAVTLEQIDALSLPTAPPKDKDNRAFEGETCQAEAIPPDVLAEIVQEAVESRLDVDARERVLERELEVREELKGRLA